MKRLAIGILAHVDAGKTTLSEALLYSCGSIRHAGRVDHGNAFLDNFAYERERGITIFSKQALLKMGDDTEITLVDTPGHVDFSGETDRALSVLDYAILVVSATDGIKPHTIALWKLLSRKNIPTFIFINKTDLPCPSREVTMRALRESFGDGCINFSAPIDELCEEIAMRDEELLDAFLSGKATQDEIKKKTASLMLERRIFPCFFGSALRFEGVKEFLGALDTYTIEKKYPDAFGAKVYKITRDDAGTRLTHMKITGGELRAKDVLATRDGAEEKVDGIRIYSGAKYTAVDRAVAGQICAVYGLDHSFGGEGLGAEFDCVEQNFEPVLSYTVIPVSECNIVDLYALMKKLEEEDPMLGVSYNERLREISVRVMGEVQLQLLERTIAERFGVQVVFGEGNIVYKETIKGAVIGSGHFEPLRHYAEVHLLIEEGERGSGLAFDTLCSENLLDKNWQRLILTHLAEKCHLGVLTGAPLTDVTISVLAGRAHKKHTEGGDFRQATYRAVRQGLMKAESVLLEPFYDFTLTVPAENVGRAMSDVGLMGGSISAPESGENGEMILVGSAPVSLMRGYAKDVAAYTKGTGRITLNFGGYKECHDPDQVIASIGYEAERDVDNTADSVFCSHGAGTVIPWQEADGMMHVERSEYIKNEKSEEDELTADVSERDLVRKKHLSYEENVLMDKELAAIFERTYGPIKRRKLPPEKVVRSYDSEKPKKSPKPKPQLPEFLLVDGYNIIFAWDDLKKVAEDNLNLARQLLINILCNYQGYLGIGVIVVFDAYKVVGGRGSVSKQGGIHVVYTKEAETADAYIERVTYEMSKKYRVRVATSDNLEQMIILGHGAERVPARVFHDEVTQVLRRIEEDIEKNNR